MWMLNQVFSLIRFSFWITFGSGRQHTDIISRWKRKFVHSNDSVRFEYQSSLEVNLRKMPDAQRLSKSDRNRIKSKPHLLIDSPFLSARRNEFKPIFSYTSRSHFILKIDSDLDNQFSFCILLANIRHEFEKLFP